jgi:hypothetical protein
MGLWPPPAGPQASRTRLSSSVGAAPLLADGSLPLAVPWPLPRPLSAGVADAMALEAAGSSEAHSVSAAAAPLLAGPGRAGQQASAGAAAGTLPPGGDPAPGAAWDAAGPAAGAAAPDEQVRAVSHAAGAEGAPPSPWPSLASQTACKGPLMQPAAGDELTRQPAVGPASCRARGAGVKEHTRRARCASVPGASTAAGGSFRFARAVASLPVQTRLPHHVIYIWLCAAVAQNCPKHSKQTASVHAAPVSLRASRMH